MSASFDSASAADIADAARRLLAGELVAFPTETVYGLGADVRTRRPWAGSTPPRAGRRTTR